MSRNAFIFGLVVIAVLIVSLYRAKSGARESAGEMAAVETQIAQLKEEKLLLNAELAHLSRPEWLEEYARRELGMGPARAQQFAREADLDIVIGPVRDIGAPRADRTEGAGQ